MCVCKQTFHLSWVCISQKVTGIMMRNLHYIIFCVKIWLRLFESFFISTLVDLQQIYKEISLLKNFLFTREKEREREREREQVLQKRRLNDVYVLFKWSWLKNWICHSIASTFSFLQSRTNYVRCTGVCERVPPTWHFSKSKIKRLQLKKRLFDFFEIVLGARLLVSLWLSLWK